MRTPHAGLQLPQSAVREGFENPREGALRGWHAARLVSLRLRNHDRRRNRFMKQRLIVPVFGAALLLAASAAVACPGGRRPSFEDLDTNGDGRVSADEFQAGAQARITDHFNRMDANGDGVVTKDEMDAARQAFRERHHRKHDRPDQPDQAD
jgi:hypothetical protein